VGVFVAVVNVPFTVQVLLARKWTEKPQVRIGGTGAAALGWPARTPHEKAWPTPTSVTEERHFGGRLTTAMAVDPDPPGRVGGGRLTHRERAERYGWPFACLKRTQWFWPDNQEWRLDAPWDSGVRLAWGVWLNPVAAGVATFVLVGTPLLVQAVLVERRRRRRGLCPGCGYPIGVSAVCTECGREIGEGVRG
jgi:hypothetical protein